ncbi:signal transduction histidine kinase [Flammeovirgaceae bacterium 311]|nr:signal transduction histidine kinase [Flammeovirgaceae bacterium 311]
MSDGLVVVDTCWNFTYLNKKFCELVGCSSDELTGKNMWAQFPEMVGTSFYEAAHLAKEKQQFTEQADFNKKINKWLERKIYPSEKGLLILYNDITERKRAEQKTRQAQQELEEFKAALSLTTMVAVTDPDGTISWVNENFCAISQYCANELVGRKHGLLTQANHSPAAYAEIVEAFSKGTAWQGEMRNKTKDGTTIWVHSTVVPFLDLQGRPSHNVIICQDITKRKIAEKVLAESERLYRTLIENYSDAVFITDLQGNITKTNHQAEELSSLSQQDIVGKNVLQFLPATLRDKLSTSLPMLLQGKSLQVSGVIDCFNAPFTAVIAIAPVKVDEQITSFFIKFSDVSKKVDYEKDIKLLNDTTLALSTTPTLKDATASVIRLLCQYGDFQYGECWMPLYGQPFIKMKSSWWFGNEYRIMKASSEFKTFDSRIDKPSILGSNKWCFSGNIQNDSSFRRKQEAATCGLQSYLSVPLIYRNKLLGVFVLFTTKVLNHPSVDADRLQELVSKLGGELERRNSAEELDRFFNLSPELLCIIGFDGFAKKSNPAFQQLLGYSEDEMSSIKVRELVHPDDISAIKPVREQMIQGRPYKNLELRYRSKDGSYRWLSCSTQSLVEENLVYVTAHDVTQQKLQLEEIERIKIAIDNTSDAISIASSPEHLLYTNPSFEKLLGWTTDKLNAIGWANIFVKPELPHQIVDLLSVQKSWEGDVQLYDTEGNSRDFNLRANIFLNQNGNIKYLCSIFTDIAEQKKAQQEVIKLSQAVEQSENEIYIINPKTGLFSYVNRRALENLGYSAAEIQRLTPVGINPGANRYSFKKQVILLQTGKSKSISYQAYHVRKDGSSYPIEIQLSRIAHGQEQSILANVMDITERRKAEEALLIINERYQLVTKATNDAIWDWDEVKQICYYGEGYKTIFGHTFGNSFGDMELWVENIHPDDVERVVENFYSTAVNKLKEWVIEYRFRCADGSYKFVKDRGYAIFDASRKVVRITGALADNTEHKRSETLLREFNTELSRKVEEKTSKLGHALRLMRQEVIARVRTEETLQQSLQEKEVLLKEIHHRVKNNMAIISGLLSLQTRHAKHPELKVMLKDSQSRIKSMALIHELLYQSDDLSKINFRSYIDELTGGISNSFLDKEKEVKISIEAHEAELDIVQAVPCALILNELLTNCFKYAFVNEQKGEVHISFERSNSQYMLSVADNGIGMPAGFNINGIKTLGMQLVKNLVQQIGGKLYITAHASQKGAVFKIVW